METKAYEIKTATLPVIPLRGLSVFPYMVLNFDVGRKQSLIAIDKAMVDDKIFLISQIDPEVEEPKLKDLVKTGTICKIKQVVKMGEEAVRVIVEGVSRATIEELRDDGGYLEADLFEYVFHQESIEPEIMDELEAYSRKILDSFEEYINIGSKIPREALSALEGINDFDMFVDTISSSMYLKSEQKQELLDTIDVYSRMDLILKIILEETEILKIEKRIALRVKRQMNKIQKEYYLREQMKAIQKELGEEENLEDEANELRKKLEAFKIPKETREKIAKEIDKLARSSSASPDTHVIRNYLELVFSLPWNKLSRDKLDLEEAKRILDEDHFGMDEVKDRIIEFLAVRKISKELKSPIVCFAGPPGVGKTSIAKSVARALGRKFVRLSLGGVRDEAEVRGHRRTYIGAIPGRIINGIKEAKTRNPVFLLDEIDKMSNDFRGDPASAMLEVLDPEQNKTFVDHYLELPFDLSNVLFITTANSPKTIPRPLLDRMEVIDVEGYIEYEKLNIARKYLLPKQLKLHGLKDDFVKMDDDVLRYIITYYTRESGVRNLERNIGKICRKIVKEYVTKPEMEGVVLTEALVDKYLGDKVFDFDDSDKEARIGFVHGMAWTEVGGVALDVEVNVLKGKGNIVLTGKLGDVMKESATTAVSYIRSICDELGIEEDFYSTKDIHIHVPEGAVPKDGPSAGITMALAVISALTGRPVPGDIAMTGEITLRGRVLAVGGIREKVLAAHRSGIRRIILPKKCERDIKKIPEEIREELEFTLVEDMREVIEKALLKKEK